MGAPCRGWNVKFTLGGPRVQLLKVAASELCHILVTQVLYLSVKLPQRLGEAVDSPEHEFWPDDLSLFSPEIFNWSCVLGHRQVTDVYLLALAVHRGGRMVTLDRRISPKAVFGAKQEHIFCIKS